MQLEQHQQRQLQHQQNQLPLQEVKQHLLLPLHPRQPLHLKQPQQQPLLQSKQHLLLHNLHLPLLHHKPADTARNVHRTRKL